MALAEGTRHGWPAVGRTTRAGVVVAIVACCLANAWQGLLAPGRAVMLAIHEDYCKRHLSKSELIHTENLYVRHNGSSRLSYLGFNLDDRPLGALMDRPERMPDVILLSSEHIAWMADLKKRPARNKMLEGSGYSYNRLPGPESLGYRHVETVRSDPSWLLTVPWIPARCRSTEIHVYRKRS
jgi:hypothetical protein